MLDLEKLRESLDRLPIFPLPKVVLLPYEILPLHVFEPRYRELIRDVLENDRPLGLVQLMPGWEGSYEGRPPIERVFGAGIVTRHEELPDGRYNILVRGLARVQLTAELPPARSYREVRARLVEDVIPDAYDLEEAAESMRRMIFALCSSKPGPGATALAQLAARAEGPGDLADMVIAALVTDHARRERSLVNPDLSVRVDCAQTAVAELLVGRTPMSEVRYRN